MDDATSDTKIEILGLCSATFFALLAFGDDTPADTSNAYADCLEASIAADELQRIQHSVSAQKWFARNLDAGPGDR